MHGVRMHGIQAWAALPNEDEEIDPGFWHHPADSLPSWTEARLRGRMIAGAAQGMNAGVKVNSPIFYMHWDMDTDATRGVPGEHAERAVYLTDGAIEVAGQALENSRIETITLIVWFVAEVRGAAVGKSLICNTSRMQCFLASNTRSAHRGCSTGASQFPPAGPRPHCCIQSGW